MNRQPSSRDTRRRQALARHRRWFTLIELLVVIAIIAILAAILLPALQHAQEQSRQMKCLNHHRQLAIGVQLYADDANDRLPGMWDNVAGDGASGGWVYYRSFPNSLPGDYSPHLGTLFPYANREEIFSCPSQQLQQGNDFAINALLGTPFGVIGYHNGLPQAQIGGPANTVLFVEETINRNGSTDDGYLHPPGNIGSRRHHGGSNYSFCDGHAERIRPEIVVYPNPDGRWRYEP